MFFRSVRFKALASYILILTITFLIFSFILYEGFRKALYDDFDDLLSSKAEGVADSISAYWHAERLLERQETAQERQSNPLESDLAYNAKSWVEEKRKDSDLMSIFVRILDTAGNRIVASKAMPQIEQISKEDFKELLEGEEDFSTVMGESPDGKKVRFRIYSKPVVKDDRISYIVQVAGPMRLMSIALHNLIFVLFILLPLTVLLAALPGVLLVRISLRPVDTMIDTLRQITAENLKRKIHIPDTKDEIRRLADTFNDMIERLDRSFSSQQRFIQDIYHELKTPVDILKTETEKALSSADSQKKCEAAFKRTLKEIESFSRVIENLAALCRFENEQQALEIKKLDLTRLVEDVLEDMRVLAEQKEVEISFYSAGELTIDGDEMQLSRMMVNLLDNALKFTHRDGRITVTVSQEKKLAKITVSDTGIGMPEEELPYIFDRFYQITRSRSSKSGFGIGLSIVKAVVEAHKGSVSVESKRGQGSTFTVTLPLSYPA
jgi:two-component system, OmpR family, sensor kinase